MPFGNGSDGIYSSATIPTLIKDSCSGTATSATLTTANITFTNGDLLLIHQILGTGFGQWEINKVALGGGTKILTLQQPLHYTFTDSGVSQAQVIKIPQYVSATVQAGTWTVPAWDGNIGGILPMAVKNTLTITGTVSLKGGNASGRNGGSEGGYRGGIGGGDASDAGTQGEGELGTGTKSMSSNGEGGGGGSGGPGGSGSGGGGSVNGTGVHGGSGGVGVQTVADLTTNFVFGGGGGGGGCQSGSTNAGGGGAGGGLGLIFARDVIISGGVTLNGGNGATGGSSVGGGSGAGGCLLLVVGTATLGSSLITSIAGTPGTAGGAGSAGRITVHHSGAITGTSNPAFTDITDGTLVENVGGYMM